jgi:hypothetical protein
MSYAMQRFVPITSVLLLFVTINDPLISTVKAFSIPKTSRHAATNGRMALAHLAAAASDADTTTTIKKLLTDRQLQFWEDVDDGLDDIESFWEKKNENIDRIRLFALRYERIISTHQKLK